MLYVMMCLARTLVHTLYTFLRYNIIQLKILTLKLLEELNLQNSLSLCFVNKLLELEILQLKMDEKSFVSFFYALIHSIFLSTKLVLIISLNFFAISSQENSFFTNS